MIFKWYKIICSYPRDLNNLLTPVSVIQNNINSLRSCDEMPYIVPSEFISEDNIPVLFVDALYLICLFAL